MIASDLEGRLTRLERIIRDTLGYRLQGADYYCIDCGLQQGLGHRTTCLWYAGASALIPEAPAPPPLEAPLAQAVQSSEENLPQAEPEESVKPEPAEETRTAGAA